MGWCSGTDIFDAVVETIYTVVSDEGSRYMLIYNLAKSLEQHDWDCHSDSVYYDNYLVQRVFKQLHPDWELDITTEDLQKVLKSVEKKDGDWFQSNPPIIVSDEPTYTLTLVDHTTEEILEKVVQLMVKVAEKLGVDLEK